MRADRLLNVAKALRESPNPEKFDMGRYAHPCGTPACALGHYAARPDLQDEFELRKLERDDGEGYNDPTWFVPALKSVPVSEGEYMWRLEPESRQVIEHFDITPFEAELLFSGAKALCDPDSYDDVQALGVTRSALEAAEWLEDFVARGGHP